jgi:DNA-directed RNA polymerase subunit RPC12/RpoP
MARQDIGNDNIPHDNPCAQCGTPILHPDWIEQGKGRTSYLWACRACGYRFEAIAIFDQAQDTHPPLAA